MTLEELLVHESIRQTMANYTMAGDRLRVDDFVAVFTEDAVLESERVRESDSFHYSGRDEIRQWIMRWSRPGETESAPRATFVRHLLSTCQIELMGSDAAKARTYWVAYTDIGADHCGHYIDIFRKVGEQWLIAHRKVRLDWRSPQSLFTSVITRSRR
jgi:3-phenylpropionate/cinnamic acid dioxygenase small subunit